MDESIFDKWQFDEFEILQVTPCSKVLAVYAIENEDQPGKHKLESFPVHFMVVARVTTQFMKRAKDAVIGTPGIRSHPPEVRNEIIGLDLLDGSFEVCNRAENFAGYCMEGEDISLATDYLRAKYFPLSTDEDND